ncbi:hypothetical protein VF14_18445 [Nostoc linckia z18]|uniref:Uncharacterized protein n=2 Tax=Nostoc linckia TaxID=92942 RepID=A0A9Q5Z994_NOSLI|nr:hypothetical protein [Nostoc linckia]PHJ81958.1 hypothetical protein VF07_29085 [Nostoc linckia z6]PHJ92856.1 hypothetical protein VF04_27800 [Nostoc linckia z7]PHK00821.1 hypothetical protein VF08_23445 [Nostoc linckia z8]PHK09360.1 hypothetical protein VF09_16230 [Nostoc linckia z9]PHK09569.1 hypothetical protein VF10_36170 [Nostoc linckia z13]
MAYTVDDYNALVKAIASGARRVKYQDREVEYRSLDDMIRLENKMKAELFPATTPSGPRRVVGIFSNGL